MEIENPAEQINAKQLMYTLVDDMCKTCLAKPNLILYVTLGTQHSEGIGFEQFATLFDSMEAACNRSLIHFTRYELFTEYMFDKHIVGIFTSDGVKPKFVRRSLCSKLVFKNEHNASLYFSLLEVSNTEPLDNGDPLQVQVYEKWTFTHKNKVRYDLIKTALGKTTEDACNQDPIFLVRMYILQDTCSPHVYTNMLIRKSFDVYGYGVNPELNHMPLQQTNKRKEV